MYKTIRVLWLLLFWISSSALAEQLPASQALTIDQAVADNISLEFSDDENRLTPKISEFKIMSLLLMSNEVGERWATITIKNLSSQQRLLDHEHLVALFANGEKRHPINAEQKFSGKEVITMVMNFGKNKFPILRIYTRN